MGAGFPRTTPRAARPLRSILAALALASLLAGCGRSTGSGDGDRVVIRYWEKWTGFEADAMRRIVDDFNASQGRVFIDFSTVSQIDRKFMLATAGGVPPDVCGLPSALVPISAENNALLPLDKMAAAAGVRRENYLDAYWQVCLHRGHLWALPTTPDCTVLVWNKRLFRAAGLDPEQPPRSIAELEEYNARLTRYRPDGGLERVGFLPITPAETDILWDVWFGGSLWDGHGTMTLDSPANVAAYRWVQSYPERFGAEKLLAFQSGFGNYASPQSAFYTGRVAMELQGVFSYNFIQRYAPPGFEWGIAAFPSVDPARLPDVSVVDADVLVIPRGAKHPHEAFEFLRYVNSRGPMEKLCLGQLKFSPLRECSPGFLASHPNPYVGKYLALAQSPNAQPAPPLTTWSACASDLREAVGKVWTGRQDAAAALAEAQRHSQSSLDHQHARWQRLSARLTAEWEREP